MEPLSHDPRVKRQIKNALYEFLYGTVIRQSKVVLDAIIIKNTLATRGTHKSFVHKGKFYTCDPTPPDRKIARLHESLQGEMQAYLDELNELNNHEIPMVVGFINQVLNSTNELHDYLKVLPDAVHSPIKDLIDTCPCKTKSLLYAEALQLQTINAPAISLMKRRLLHNILIQ